MEPEERAIGENMNLEAEEALKQLQEQESNG